MTRRAFTLIEVTIVVAIIAITAAIMLPALSRQKAQIAQRNFTPSLRRIASSARTAAIDRNATTYLAWDDAQAKVILYQQGTADGGDELLSSIPIPTGITTDSFLLNDQSSNSGDWKLHYYSDGTAESGGVGYTDSGKTMNLTVNVRGIGLLVAGNLPDASASHWPAGDYEHRQ